MCPFEYSQNKKHDRPERELNIFSMFKITIAEHYNAL